MIAPDVLLTAHVPWPWIDTEDLHCRSAGSMTHVEALVNEPYACAPVESFGAGVTVTGWLWAAEPVRALVRRSAYEPFTVVTLFAVTTRSVPADATVVLSAAPCADGPNETRYPLPATNLSNV